MYSLLQMTENLKKGFFSFFFARNKKYNNGEKLNFLVSKSKNVVWVVQLIQFSQLTFVELALAFFFVSVN